MRLGREHRPYVELREHQRVRPECIERGSGVAGRVERQVIAKIHVEAARESRRTGRKVRVRQLYVLAMPTHELEHRARLQPLSHRWRMHPEERSRRIPVRSPPIAKTTTDAAPRVQRARELRLARR